jgi:hypothetical protein
MAISQRRHPRQKREDAVNVSGLEGAHEPLHEVPDPVVAGGAAGDLPALVGHALLDGLAGTLKGAVDGRHGCLEELRHLACRESEYLSQDEDRTLAARQVLQRREERELQGLTLLVASFRRCVSAFDPVALARIGLDSDGRSRVVPGMPGRIGRRSLIERQGRPRATCELVEAHVRGDLVQPGSDGSSLLDPWQTTPGAQERVLHRVLGVMHRTEHPVAVGVKLRAMWFDEAIEAGFVAGERCGECIKFRHGEARRGQGL